MATAFRRRGRGAERRYVATLDADERRVLASLMDQVHDLLEPPETTSTGDDAFDDLVAGLDLGGEPAPAAPPAPAEPPQERDPALDRLLPTANREDDEAAAEFRRLTEGGLRHRKAGALATASAALRHDEDRVSLDADEARAFLTALTDVRLVLGERLQLRGDEDLELLERAASSLEEGEPLHQLLALYDFLTWLQETLADALLRG
ncbi:DUF2017 family protein [Phycicoccus avicenniae]|uniref:DUF2017 family protein n=1 Tax=Phycicoccus avicenniae TaxID=2828860 RepID=UPI003D2940B9